MQEGNKKLAVQIVIFLVVFAVAFLGTKYVMSSLTSTESIVEATSMKLNKKCPMMLSRDLRLDSTDAMAVEGKAGLLYICTLINEDVNTENYNSELIAKEIELAAQKDFESNPDMEKARERDATIYYVCKDKNGNSVLGFEINSQKNNPKK